MIELWLLKDGKENIEYVMNDRPILAYDYIKETFSDDWIKHHPPEEYLKTKWFGYATESDYGEYAGLDFCLDGTELPSGTIDLILGFELEKDKPYKLNINKLLKDE